MKKIIVMALFVCICFPLFSISEISFEKLSFDFGKIKEENGPYEHKFVFANTGDEPFKLTKVKAG